MAKEVEEKNRLLALQKEQEEARIKAELNAAKAQAEVSLASTSTLSTGPLLTQLFHVHVF